MSFIGHVYPALFYVACGAAMLLQSARAHRCGKDVLYATNGGSRFLRVFGALVMGVTMTGILVEGAGGALTFGNFAAQAAHQSIHLSFFVAGLVCVLESYKRVPFDSWRLFLSLGFLIEALVFYGHQLEQSMPESTLHLVMAAFALVTSATFFASVWFPRSLLLHALNIVGIFMQGVWLLWIAYVIYTGAFGPKGEGFMMADVYMSAGLWLLVVVCLVGAFFTRRGGSDADADADAESDFSYASHSVASPTKYVAIVAEDKAPLHPPAAQPCPHQAEQP